MTVRGGARRDDVVEAGEGEGKHGVQLHAAVPLLEVAPPHPAVGDPRLHPPQQPHRVPPQDVAVPQPRQPPRATMAAAPRELPLPLVLLRFRPVGRVHRRAAHVERSRRNGLETEQIGNSAPDNEAPRRDAVTAGRDVRTENEKAPSRMFPARVLPK